MATVDFSRYKRMVQMFWDPEPTNDTDRDQPVWCLGRQYRLGSPSPDDKPSGDSPRLGACSEASSFQKISRPALATPRPDNAPETPPDSSSSSFSSSLAYDENWHDGGWPATFLDDFDSRFWMTYRSNFDPIPKSPDPKALSALSLSMRIKSQLIDQNGFTSDSGWGCMIRSGQSLLANAISIHRLGRNWRRKCEGDIEERRIISMFADDPRAPYSIHNFVKHGAEACGKFPGEWFGPSATARCIQALANEHESLLRVYSTGDGPDVYEDSFMQVAHSGGESFHPTLILVGTRLGIDKITPVYWEALIATLQLPQSIGIAGGRPASSHYFVGTQGSHLFYLDPHQTRPALPYHQDLQKYTTDDVGSCHTKRLRRLHVREMDPSMLIGFLIRDLDDWLEWRQSLKHVQGKSVISVTDGSYPDRGVKEREAAVDEVETLSDEDEDAVLDSGQPTG